MKELLYLKDDHLKEFIEKLFFDTEKASVMHIKH